jgi:hypothetical protein
MKFLETTPERKQLKRQNGLDFIKTFGRLAGPKMENRRRGAAHHFFGKPRIGDKAPRWIDGRTPENERIRHSLEYKKWRIAVFERDNYSCTHCGDDKGGNLNADHIKPFSLFPELRLDVNNGRTLCGECHKKIGWSLFKERNPKHNGANWVGY